MAKDTNRILDETIGAFKRLKDEVKAYKDELATLKVGTEEWNAAAEKLRNAQKQVDAINKSAKGTLVDYNNAQQNSINYLKERIKLLTQERNAMDMDSKEYKKATAELKELNDKLRDAQTSAGDWKANVGNYAQSIGSAFTELGTAATGLSGNIGGLNAGLLKLASNPVGAVIAAVAGGVSLLANGIKSSEENTNKWNEAMIPLKTIVVMVQNEVQKLAGKFADWVISLRQNETAIKVVHTALKVLVTIFEDTKVRIQNLISALGQVKEGFSNAFDKAKGWVEGVANKFPNLTEKIGNAGRAIKEKIYDAMVNLIGLNDKIASSWIGKLLGLKTSQQIKEIGNAAEETTEKIEEEFKTTEQEVTRTTKASNALAATLRGLGVQAANLSNEVKDLSAQYAEALEAKDYEKAQDILNKKKEKEIELAKTQAAMAQANYNVIKQQNALTQSSTEDLNAENDALIAVINSQGALADVTRQNATEQKKLNSLMESEKKKEQAEALKNAVAELNIELNKYTQNYQSAISIEAPERPDIFTYGNTDSYYDQIKENAQIEYDAYATMTEQKIAKLQEWLDEQRAAGIEEKDLSSQVIELEKLKGEAAAGYPQQYKKMIDTQNKADKERAKTLKVLQKNELKGYVDLFDGISGLFEQDSIAYKATAVAKAIVSTYLAASESFANAGGAPWGFIPMAASIAAGLAQVKQILSVNAKGETSAPSAASSTPSVAEPVMVESQPFTYTRTAQTFEEEEQLNQPLFVSVTDINNVQNRVRVTEEESSF